MGRRAEVLAQQVAPLAERRRALEAEPLPDNIGALLDAAAAEVPDHPAWNFFERGETITYRALQAAVARLANGFAAIGVERGTHVGVMLPNVPEMPLTWLALGRIGAVMVPVNLRYTAREVHYTLDDSQADFFVCDHEHLGLLRDMPAPLPRLAGHVISVGGPGGDRRWSGLSAGQPDRFVPAIPPALDDLMNIQYTSGTTGFPKGCMLTHRYWLICAKTHADCDGRRFKRILAANPFFYMTPQWSLLSAFFHRSTLFVGSHRSATHYMRWIREHRIDFTLFPEICMRQPPDPLDAENKIIRVSTYNVRREFNTPMEQRFDFVAREAFGMTEIGAGLFVPIEATDMVGSGSCGIATPFREARIADEHGNPLPPDTPGELCFRGPGLLRGYWNRPEATEAAFHGDWFRTGDLARMDGRGYVWIKGRIKDMIKRAGENVAANEVEAVLTDLPGIAEAAVVAVPDALRSEEVKAYVVLAEGHTPSDLTPERILAHCNANLAVFKVPRYLAYRTLPLPRTASGKIRKPDILAGVADLRAGSWDRVEQRWHAPEGSA